ncbi:MAG: hypothetical protein KGJ43_05945, partial [Acidobacteriota bacterium]|nr:hypothetical protein [Acidobacteriota bacterium]
RRNALAYVVSCSTACTGTTAFRAVLARPHKHPVALGLLRFGPRRVSIRGSTGGNQRIVATFSRKAIAKLRRLLKGKTEAKLTVTFSAKGTAGGSLTVTRILVLRH